MPIVGSELNSGSNDVAANRAGTKPLRSLSMDESGFQSQFRAFLDMMSRPEGIVVLVVLLVLMVAVAASRHAKWVVLALLLWVPTMSFTVNANDPWAERRLVPLLPPFDQMRAQGRPICAALLLMLLVPTILSSRGWRQKWLGPAAITLLLFQLLL